MTKLYESTFVIGQNKREIRVDCSSSQDIRNQIIWELCKKEKGVLLGVVPHNVANTNRIKKLNTLFTFLNDGSVLYEIKDVLSFYPFYWGYYLFYIVDIKEEAIIKKIEKNYLYLRSKDFDDIACKGVDDSLNGEAFNGFSYLKFLLITFHDIDAIRIIPVSQLIDDVKSQVMQIMKNSQVATDISSEEFKLK